MSRECNKNPSIHSRQPPGQTTSSRSVLDREIEEKEPSRGPLNSLEKIDMHPSQNLLANEDEDEDRTSTSQKENEERADNERAKE